MNNEMILKDIREQFKEYIQNSNLKSVVLGISGGIDSAIVAAILSPVCTEIGIKLIGISLPSNSNETDETARADLVGNAFCDTYATINIDSFTESFLQLIPGDTFAEKVRKGNMKARTRMILLYEIAGENSGCVLSTDNLTEYYLGFWTLHGDVGDLGPIQNLWKTEVYELAKWICNNELPVTETALEKCIDATPTDGLGITSSDLDQIGVPSYAIADKMIQKYLEDKTITPENNKVITRVINTEFKRNNPYNFEIKKGETK